MHTAQERLSILADAQSGFQMHLAMPINPVELTAAIQALTGALR